MFFLRKRLPQRQASEHHSKGLRAAGQQGAAGPEMKEENEAEGTWAGREEAGTSSDFIIFHPAGAGGSASWLDRAINSSPSS